MNVLVINSGSSSIKYQLFAMPEAKVLAKGLLEKIGEETSALKHTAVEKGKEKKLEQKLLPNDIEYKNIKGLRLEARQKLDKIKPNSIGQASRISGVSPADISVLLIYLEQLKRK